MCRNKLSAEPYKVIASRIKREVKISKHYEIATLALFHQRWTRPSAGKPPRNDTKRVIDDQTALQLF